METEALLQSAEEALRKAATIVLDYYQNVAINTKASNNLVTEADINAEKAIVAHIGSSYPTHRFLGEEGAYDSDTSAENLWIIDPLDGTNNYAHGIPVFSLSIAFAHRGEVICGAVYDPVHDELYTAARGKGAYMNGRPITCAPIDSVQDAIVACGFHYDRGEMMKKTIDTIHRLFTVNIRGIRRTGSAALDLCWVATGRFDAFFEYKLAPWDFAAGKCIVEEAGGECRDKYGSALTLDSEGIISTAPGIADSIIESVRWR